MGKFVAGFADIFINLIKLCVYITIFAVFFGFWSYFNGNDTVQVSADKWLITQIVHSAYNVGVEFAKQGSQHYEGIVE